MAKLRNVKSGIVTKWPKKFGFKRKLLSIGRNDANDLTIYDPFVSRFHATIIKDEEDYYLISHGLLGTFYPLTKSNRPDAERVMEAIFGPDKAGTESAVFEWNTRQRANDTVYGRAAVLSHNEARIEQCSASVPNIPSYQDHMYPTPESIHSLWRSIRGKGRNLIIPLGKKLEYGNVIALPGEKGFNEFEFLE